MENIYYICLVIAVELRPLQPFGSFVSYGYPEVDAENSDVDPLYQDGCTVMYALSVSQSSLETESSGQTFLRDHWRSVSTVLTGCHQVFIFNSIQSWLHLTYTLHVLFCPTRLYSTCTNEILTSCWSCSYYRSTRTVQSKVLQQDLTSGPDFGLPA